jgi:opacity protein-like surface antigen
MPSKPICAAFAVATGVALLAFEGAAQADGSYGQVTYPYEPAPFLPPPLLWRGFYIGGNIGGAWAIGTLNDNFTGTGFDTDHSGFIGGGQLGFNYQVRNLVLGVEWDFDWTSMSEVRNDVFVPQFGTLRASADTDWITTLAGRVGLANDRWLAFVKAGGGWVHNSATLTNLTTGAVASTSDTNGGFLVGGGVEYALTGHWTARAEFDYLALSDRTATGFFGNTFTFQREIEILKIGLNYKF